MSRRNSSKSASSGWGPAGAGLVSAALTAGGVSRQTGSSMDVAQPVEAAIDRRVQDAPRLFPIRGIERAFFAHGASPARRRSIARKASNTFRICAPL